MAKVLMMYQAEREAYVAPDGRTMAREQQTKTPNGNAMNGRWVLRDAAGVFLDFDRYRNDLAERHDVTLVGDE